jgi:hypothetical protein
MFEIAGDIRASNVPPQIPASEFALAGLAPADAIA